MCLMACCLWTIREKPAQSLRRYEPEALKIEAAALPSPYTRRRAKKRLTMCMSFSTCAAGAESAAADEELAATPPALSAVGFGEQIPELILGRADSGIGEMAQYLNSFRK